MKLKNDELKNTTQSGLSKPSIETLLAKGLLILGCLLVAGAATAQTKSKEPSTVHIKKIETINGVTKVTDTTYTSTDQASILIKDGIIDIRSLPGEEDEIIHTMMSNNTTGTGKISVTGGKELDEQISIQIEQALKEAGIDENTVKGENVLIINESDTGKEGATKQVMITKTIIKHIDIKDADEKELKRLGQSGSQKEQKLNLANMSFYPNPNTGKFNLSFSLPEKGDAEVTILNTEGKVVYTEKLPAFSGNYDQEIDISKQAKGIYFVKVEQGKNSQVKKIVLE